MFLAASLFPTHLFTCQWKVVSLIACEYFHNKAFYLVTKKLFIMKYSDFRRVSDTSESQILKVSCYLSYTLRVVNSCDFNKLPNYCITDAVSLKGNEKRQLKDQWQLWTQTQHIIPNRNPPLSPPRVIFQVTSIHNLLCLNFAKRKSLNKSGIIQIHSSSLLHPGRIKLLRKMRKH